MRNIHEFEVKNLLRMANDAKERMCRTPVSA